MKRIIASLIVVTLLVSNFCSADEPDKQIVLPLAGATASSTYANNLPSYAIDSSAQTYWNSGVAPSSSRVTSVTPWIQFDMGETKSVSKLRLRPAQSPAGTTTHAIYIGNSPGALQFANSVTSYTVGGVAFEVPVMASGRYIRIVTTSSPSWVAWEQVDAFEAKGVRYYGYYLGGDYNAATSGHSNISFFYGDDSAQTRIQNAAAVGMKSVVSVDQVFFNGKSLRADYLTRWNNLASRIASQSNNIAAFYVIDEPARIGASYADVKAAVDAIKSVFPAIPTASIFDGDNINGLVSLFDWVGLDNYDNGAGLYGYFTPTVRPPIPALYDRFRSKLDLSRQRIILVPQAGMPKGTADGNSNSYNYGLTSEADVFLSKALNDPAVIAVMPFIWQNILSSQPYWYGVEQFPVTKAKFTDFGTQIVQRSKSRYWPY